MKWTDRFLQRWRIRKVLPYIKPGARVLDIGSADGALFQFAPKLAAGCLGIDPTLKAAVTTEKFALIPGFFPKDMPTSGPFDVITMLAVLEHFPEREYAALAEGCGRFLAPQGFLLITVPSPAVDTILKWLTFFRLVDGMSLEQHHGYEVDQTTRIFPTDRFQLVCRKTFQLGLNNLFVFRRV
jgi:2-polyprenyl-3-methyl-5-hydroxy-6-metoxy-1,4-benzoquinol methylase